MGSVGISTPLRGGGGGGQLGSGNEGPLLDCCFEFFRFRSNVLGGDSLPFSCWALILSSSCCRTLSSCENERKRIETRRCDKSCWVSDRKYLTSMSISVTSSFIFSPIWSIMGFRPVCTSVKKANKLSRSTESCVLSSRELSCSARAIISSSSSFTL